MKEAPSKIRYYVLLMSFVVAAVMYMDRAVMASASMKITKEFGLTNATMGVVASAFTLTYSLFQIPGGWTADRYGSRTVLTVAIVWWSVFTMGTGLSWSLLSLLAMRSLFGMGEAAAWPAAARSLGRWLPARQRGFGQGFQHSGSRFGTALAPLIAMPLVDAYGWRVMFYAFGAVGFVLAVTWYWFYRDQPREHSLVNRGELALLDPARPASQAKPAAPWSRILRSSDLWFLSALYFCYGWVFWMYMQWFPTYLVDARHFPKASLALASSLPYWFAWPANVAGGWISDKLVRRSGNLRRGRIAVSIAGFLIAGLGILPGALVADPYLALACLTVALAALELTVGVSWAMCMDMAGEYGGSVTGVMNTLGNLGGSIATPLIGFLVDRSGWTLPFVLSSLMCLVAALLATQIDPRRPAVGELSKQASVLS
jgi:sugar phosphate permease